jgi:hypothetical protein
MSEQKQATQPTFGLMAEFETPGQLLRAAQQVRDAGYKRWDCHTPFPVHGLDRAMGLRDTKLPFLVFGAGITGTGAAMLMQWWMNAIDYPLVIAGKPIFSVPANIPVAFEVTVLFASITAFAGMFLFNNLPKFFHPAFRSRRFRQVTNDRFFIIIEAADPQFDPQRTTELLRSVGGGHIERLEE